MIDTGEIVLMCRKGLHWTRPKLSEISGVGVPTILSVERNSDCKVSTFETLLEAMGYEIEIMRKEI